jgi:hypothetical protein
MSSNGALIPIRHTDMDESTALSGNDGPFSAERTNFLQYSLGSDETFISDEYMGVSRAPLLSSHTIDGSSSYSGQEYEATMHARAPLLRSHTMDGSSNISTEHKYGATVLDRASLLASHAMDRSSSYQPVCHFEASARARIPSREYAVDRRQSVTNEEIAALYGQTSVSGSYG